MAPLVVLGRYELHGEIGAGGMARVHFARMLGEGGFARVVAVKRLHPAYATDPEFSQMLMDEGRLAARVRHPNVVPLLDVVSSGGELALVLDYVHGESLSRLLPRPEEPRELPPIEVAVAISVAVLHGLHAAHEATDARGAPLSLVHRDVSPHNVVVGVDGVARVLDFGVAKALGRSQTTREGQIKGKLAYMAPEQLLGGEIDRRVDVFAASIVLWESLTGKRLFHADSEGLTVTRVLSGDIPPPSELRPGISPLLDDVVLRGLARERDERYPDAAAMAAALETVGPLAPPSQIGAWVRRNAGPQLEERAALIAAIERGSASAIPIASQVTAQPPAARAVERTMTAALSQPPPALDGTRTDAALAPREAPRARSAWPMILGLGVAAAGGLLAWRAVTPRAPEPTPAAVAPSPPVVAVSAPAEPASAASAAPASSAAAPVPPASVVADGATSAKGRAPAGKVRVPARPSCDPPYTTDENGIRRVKKECVGR